MKERENAKVTHLMILVVYTIFTFLLAGESYLMKWEPGPVILLLLGMIICWGIYILEKVPTDTQLWMAFLLTQLAIFFYGSHESSIYDLAPFVIMIIILYAITEKPIFIRLCVGTYYFIIFYDFLFVLKFSLQVDTLAITRIMLHFMLVFVSGYLVNLWIKRQNKKKGEMHKVIGELEETNRRTEDFLTNVSHELRTPINVVTGITTIMLKNEEDEEKRKDVVSIQKAGHRLFEQIEDILDYTEIDTGRMKISEESYMISSVIHDIITGNRLTDRENALELIFDVDPKIPSMLIGDVKKIKKIICHLLDNAYKFTKVGGICVQITTLQKPYGVNLCIKVVDTGIGIDKDELGKIMAHFYQSSAGRNRKAGGLGLGLSIVYGMVSAMEGFIQIKSEVGKGTTVSISIPQKVANEAYSMVVERKDALSVGCFLMPEKYPVPEVRGFYHDAISHLAEGMDLGIHRVYKKEDLEKLLSHYSLTHLFIGWEEYCENKQYLEELAKQMEVIVMANEIFALPKDSRAICVQKPFFALPLISKLNTITSREENLTEQVVTFPNVRVLVVDDESMNLMVAEGIFKNYQMLVTLAGSGKEAIELCKENEYDVIFLDHMMPEMDGVETLKYIRDITEDTGKQFKIIAFTANAVSGAREMFIGNGFDEFISKPIEINELERILKKVLPKKLMTGRAEPMDAKKREIKQADAVKKNEKEAEVKENKPAEEAIEEAKTEEKDVLASLQAMGLNTTASLQYSQNDVEFYTKLALKFAGDQKAKSKELEDYLLNQDCANYKVKVHALKSSARLIGADKLSDMALQLELASGKQDLAFVQENHEALIKEYKEICKNILLILEGEKAEQDTALPQISKEDICSKLQELIVALQEFEIDQAEAILSDLSNYRYNDQNCKEMLADISTNVEDFEYDEAVNKTQELKQNIERGEIH